MTPLGTGKDTLGTNNNHDTTVGYCILHNMLAAVVKNPTDRTVLDQTKMVLREFSIVGISPETITEATTWLQNHDIKLVQAA